MTQGVIVVITAKTYFPHFLFFKFPVKDNCSYCSYCKTTPVLQQFGSLILHNAWKVHLGEHVFVCAQIFPLSANLPSSPEKMFALFNFQSLLSSCPFSSLPLHRVNSQGAVYMPLLGCSWLPCGAPAGCVNQHFVTHTSLPQPPVTKCPEKINW